MDKRNAVLAAIGIVFICATVFAQPRKASITIGGSYWNANLVLPEDIYQGITADPGNMVGPYLNMRFGNWLLGGSMFFGTFTLHSGDAGTGFDLDIKRNDQNFSFGYSLFKNFNVFAALKSVSYSADENMTTSYYDPYWGYRQGEGRVEMDNTGKLVGGGVSSVVPFSKSPFFLYGSAAYLTGKMDYSYSVSLGGTLTDLVAKKVNANLLSWSVGIGIQTSSGFSILVGYRMDSDSVEDGGEEQISGLTATVAYTLR